MFERNVLVDGTVCSRHEAVAIEHTLGNDTIVTVSSTSDAGFESTNSFSHGLDPTLSFGDAEAWAMGLGFFREYESDAREALDALLPLLTDGQAAMVPAAFGRWEADHGYSAGDRVSHGGLVYRCLQAHTSQDGWEPDVSASLWARLLAPGDGTVAEWVQPDSTNPYMTGDKVTHNGQTWESTVDGNVWEPGVYGWITV